MGPKEEPVLRVRGLGKRYGKGCPDCEDLPRPGETGRVCPACGSVWGCRDVSFDIYPGEILGVVGESGSGKSTLARCLYFDEEPTEGEMVLSGWGVNRENLLSASAQERRRVRHHALGMVYQHPTQGLRMRFSSSGNIAEKLLAADFLHVGRMRARAADLLQHMEIPVERMDEPPRRFSGGMQQRVQIAKALANGPSVLLLDEVTTGLDVSVQARVLDLLRRVRRETGVAMLLISHDLGVIRLLADRTAVMRGGRVVEEGITDQILEDPQHPYTQLLVHSLL